MATALTVRPSIFIGSSAEGLAIAQAVQLLLDRSCEAEVWSQGIFGLTEGTLESLVLSLDRFDFAVLVLTADDMTTARGIRRPSARDNVLFELGFFIGGLGRECTFMIYDRSDPPELPSDLAGVTPATFEPHASGNLAGALGAPCTQIQHRIARLGLREDRRASRLEGAADDIENVRSHMEDLIKLLARSRKVELEIILQQFGSLIDSTKLRSIKEDLKDLENLLDQSPR